MSNVLFFFNIILFTHIPVPPMADCNSILCIILHATLGFCFQNISKIIKWNEIKKKGHYALVKFESQSITQIYL